MNEKVSAIVKIVGLALGLTAFLIVFSYINFEKSYDKFFSNSPNVSRLALKITNEAGQVWNGAFVSPPVLDNIKRNCPEVITGTKMYFDNPDASFHFDGKVLESSDSYFVDSNFFQVYNVEFIEGESQKALNAPNSAVMTESTAERFFGTRNAIGKTFKYMGWIPFTVTGVCLDFPKNSSIDYEILMSYTTPNFIYPENEHRWDLHFLRVFLLLDNGVDQKHLEEKINEIALEHVPQSEVKSTFEYYLEPIEIIHLETRIDAGKESGVSNRMVNLLFLVACFILLIAIINHLNLSASQLLKRLRLYGIEKALGQKNAHLFSKSITECSVVFVISLMISLILVTIITPSINSLLDKDISLAQNLGKNILVISGIIIVGVLVTTTFKYIFISKVNWSKSIAGLAKSTFGNNRLRTMLVLFQFFISLVLLFITLVFYKQTNHLFKKDIGMDNDYVIVVKGKTIYSYGNEEYPGKIKAFKNELLSNPNIEGITSSNFIPGRGSYFDGVRLASNTNDESKSIQNSIIQCDRDFIGTYGIKLLAGKDFKDLSESANSYAIINEKCAKALGFNQVEDAIGHIITREFYQLNYEIIGVSENFVNSNLVEEIMPITMYLVPEEHVYYSVKYSSMETSAIIDKISDTWKKVFNKEACKYFFLNENYKKVYAGEYLQVKIFSACSLIAIIIACIGLFGLAYYSILQKTKEIGVRKVNGAKVKDILLLIGKEYLALILYAAIPGMGLGYYISLKWLENYYSRITIGIQFFIIPIVILLTVMIITIVYHATRVALRNPIEALRYE